MATTPVNPAPGAPAETKFDPIAHMAKRNAADAAQAGVKEPEPAKRETPVAQEPADNEPEVTLEQHTPKLPRSVRRELNQLRERSARVEGELEAYKKLGVQPPKPEAATTTTSTDDDPEPVQANFGTVEEFTRALNRWDARQETKKLLQKQVDDGKAGQQVETLKTTLQEMDKRATEQAKLIPDWDEVAKKAEDNPDLNFSFEAHPNLALRMGQSDVRALLMYHFAKFPEEFKAIVKLTDDLVAQDRAISRLEGRIEKLYAEYLTPEGKEAKPAAQAAPKGKDRSDPADGVQPGRNSAERDAGKPRPSSEVSARGGSAAPNTPTIGSPEWMAERNLIESKR